MSHHSQTNRCFCIRSKHALRVASTANSASNSFHARFYLNVIQIEFFKLSIIVLQLLQAGINVRSIWAFLLEHLEISVLGNALQEYTAIKPAIHSNYS